MPSIYRAPASHRWKSPAAPIFDATRAGKPRLKFEARNGKAPEPGAIVATRWGGPETNGLLDWEDERITAPKDPLSIPRLVRYAARPAKNRRIVATARRADGSRLDLVVRANTDDNGRITTQRAVVFHAPPGPFAGVERITKRGHTPRLKLDPAIMASLRTPAPVAPPVTPSGHVHTPAIAAQPTIADRLAQFMRER